MSDIIQKDGLVVEALIGAQFKVKLEDGKEIRTYLAGKMRRNHIRIFPGDTVIIELTSNIAIVNQVGRIIRRK